MHDLTPRVLRRCLLVACLLLPACGAADQDLGPSEVLPPSEEHLTTGPGGMFIVTENDWAGFNSLLPLIRGLLSGWTRYLPQNTGRMVYDPSARCGSPFSLEVNFPAGMQEGSGTEHLRVAGPSGESLDQLGDFRQLYLEYCVWVPSTWEGPGSGVQKLFHIWGTSDDPKGYNTQALPTLYGAGDNNLSHQLRLQNLSPDSDGSRTVNIRCGSATRGEWDRVEVYLVQNTGGQADGQIRMWLNGQLCASEDDIMWSDASHYSKQWKDVQLNPTRGSSGFYVNSTQRLRYGGVKVSVY